MEIAGSITSKKLTPHVYFIICEDYLYIGETSRHPCLRWGEHISNAGSFSKAYFKYSDRHLNENDDIHCIAIDISQEMLHSELKDYPQTIARQAIETAIHQAFDVNPFCFNKQLRLISDISKTTPRSFRKWPLVKSMGKNILNNVSQIISEKIHEQ